MCAEALWRNWYRSDGRLLDSAAIIVKGDDMARRGSAPEFRRRVVEWVEGGRKVSEVAADLGISEQTIYTWRRRSEGG